MFKFFCVFAVAAVLSSSAVESLINDVGYESVSRNNFRALAGGISDKIADFISDVLALPDTVDKHQFLDPAEALLIAAEELQNSIFDVDTGVSIIELFRIDEEIDQLRILFEQFKAQLNNSTTTGPAVTTPAPVVTTTTGYSNPDVKRTFEWTCTEVDKSKAEILTYPPEECSGHKLLPNLTECQNLCSRVRPYYNELINSPPSVADQQVHAHQLSRCKALVEIWWLLRKIQPDRPTLDQTCYDISILGSEINRFSVAQCEKDPFLKDQKTLAAICLRLQREYSNIDPDVLLTTYKDLVSKLEELNFKWTSYKKTSNQYVIQPSKPQNHHHHHYPRPIPVYPTNKPTYNPSLYNYEYQGKANPEKGSNVYTSIFKPLPRV